MNKIIFILFCFFSLSNCSLDNKTNIWSNKNSIKKENDYKSIIFENNEVFENEFNSNVRILIKDKYTKFNKKNFNENNLGINNYSGELIKLADTSFSKINHFGKYLPDITLLQDGSLIFFDKTGRITKYSKNLKPIWSKNYYSKKEKKMKPFLNFGADKNLLVVTDSLSNYYLLNSDNGKLLWKNKNSAAFNSEIKISNDKIFTVDYDNTLKCFSLKSGKLIWDFKNDNTLIKSTKRTSLVTVSNKVIFLSNTGDLNSVDQNGKLIWQTPTSNSILFEDSFTNTYSDIVYEANFIYFSNNKNEIFAISSDTGNIKWRKRISSRVRPIITKDLVITISDNGFLIILNKNNGNLIRSTNIKTKFKKKNLDVLINSGFVIGKNKIYLSTNGTLNIIDLSDGKSKKIVNINKKFINRPYIYNKSMYILSNKFIIKYN